MTYFSKEFLEVLKQNMKMSEETWHKVMNPFCGKCLKERGENAQTIRSNAR